MSIEQVESECGKEEAVLEKLKEELSQIEDELGQQQAWVIITKNYIYKKRIKKS